MKKVLPARPHLDHIKGQAKDLLDAFRRGDESALSRFREALPAARGRSDAELSRMPLALHDAQSAIAREYGFDSFALLREHVARIAPTPENLRELMQRHMHTPPPPAVERALLAAAADAPKPPARIPDRVPLVPLRNALLAAGAVAPLSLARPASRAAADHALASDRLLGVFSQIDAANEAPGESDLHRVGALAFVSATVPHEAGLWLVVRAIGWVRLVSIETSTPYLVARVEPFVVTEQGGPEVARLELALRERVRAFAATMPDPESVLAQTERMSALELADATVANLTCDVADKARYVSESSLLARLEQVLALADRAP